MKTPLLLLLLAFASYNLLAQKSPVKFGDIPMEDMKMTLYAKDSSAVAVVLVDYGESYIQANAAGWALIFERHVRIKILKNDGLKWADVAINLWHFGSIDERISNLKASTYNLEGGEIAEIKMAKEGVFKTRVNKNINQQKFTLPNVKAGSIIEYSYKINSEMLTNFPDWEFQKEIPVRHSEYWAIIPEVFVFEKYMQGFLSLTKYEVKSNAHHFIMQNVPAFIPEPYMACEADYLSKINFAISQIRVPGQMIQDIMGSWDKLNTRLLEDEDFGKVISRSGFLKEKVDALTAGITDPLKKIEVIHSYIKENIEWDGTEDKYADNIKKVLENKRGTAADINLTMASMLEKAGFNVQMVLLSTRNHGIVRPNYPMERQFNYAVCSLKLADKTLLLDATEKHLPVGTLPERCLNGQGMLISELHYSWVDITSKIKAKTSVVTELKLEKSGTLKGKVSLVRDGYDALKMRNSYHKKGEREYVKDFLASKTWQVESTEFENVKTFDKPVKQIHTLTIEDHATVMGDVIYINPFLYGQLKENPFKPEARQYPVDFGPTAENLNITQITIPEGYTIDELPQSRILVMPGNAAKYLYSATQQGNLIAITSNLQINKSLFLSDEYPNLREFYSQVVAKQAEQIVLKKK
jgi:hypothetical protein